MNAIRTYKDILAWQKSVDLSAMVYVKTTRFPREELYGLAQQMRRAGVSVMSNIAEGWGRGSTGDYLRFLRTSRGSLCELEAQIHLTQRLNFLAPMDVQELLNAAADCSKVLQGLIGSVEYQQKKSHLAKDESHGEW